MEETYILEVGGVETTYTDFPEALAEVDRLLSAGTPACLSVFQDGWEVAWIDSTEKVRAEQEAMDDAAEPKW